MSEELAGVDGRHDAARAGVDAELDAAPKRRDVEVAAGVNGVTGIARSRETVGCYSYGRFPAPSRARGRGWGCASQQVLPELRLVELDAQAGAVGHAEDTVGTERARQQVSPIGFGVEENSKIRKLADAAASAAAATWTDVPMLTWAAQRTL